MIAAGEVVERPSSVVKELVENSLDAGAREIVVEIERGGRKMIRVADDGEGMSRDDAFLCLERHATSKLRKPEDLSALTTLGFRGEALPAIASVSRLTLQTCGNDDGEGVEVHVEGGTIRQSREMGLPRGTLIDVRNLFFNTPARRKFLRRDETEIGHIADVVTKQALAHPDVQFRLLHNGRCLFEVRRDSSLAERIAAFLGRPLLKQLLPVEIEDDGDLALSGYICPPEVNRSTSGAIYTFINGRCIRDRVVQHAVIEGYRNLLMKGRFPVVVLFLKLDPAMVDVNVHPTKHEVRFRDQRRVHDFIAASLKQTLQPAAWLDNAPAQQPSPEAQSQPSVSPPVTSQYPLPHNPETTAASGREQIQESLDRYARRSSGMPPAARPYSPPPGSAPGGATSDPELEMEREQERRSGFFSSLRYLGQYHNSYLLCQQDDDLLLIDQHAAHERIRFEKLRRDYRRGQVPRQGLLFPEVVEFDFKAAAALQEGLDTLAAFGFEIEPFGGKAFAVKSVPAVLGQTNVEELLHDVAADLETIGKSGVPDDAVDEFLMRLACHGVIRANQALAPPEVQALLDELDQVDFKAHCPHGRPVQVRLSLAEIERLFKRT
jgi:DNA mismatch repair protein MutL